MQKIKAYIIDFIGGLNCSLRNKHKFEYFNGYGYRCKYCFKTKKMVRDMNDGKEAMYRL